MKTIKARHKLIPAIIMLIVAAITMSTASYAWFTMSNKVEVTGIELQVVAPTNLLIREGTSAPFLNVATVSTNPSAGGKLSHASSLTGATMYTVEDATKGVNTDGDLITGTAVIVATTTPVSAVDVAGGEGYYMDFMFQLVNTGALPAKIGLNNVKINAVTTSAAGLDVVEAVRFAILDGGANDDGVFSLNPKTLDVYDGTVLGTTVPLTTINAKTTEMFTVQGGSDANVTTPLNVKDITVRVWIEGQDPACKSLNAGSSFSISFELFVID